MAATKVVDLIAKAGLTLLDVNGVRWPLVELQGWLNDGYTEIVNLRPDATATVGTFTCAAGTLQTLSSSFATAQRLLMVVNNSAGKPVRLVPLQALDNTRPAWHAETQTADTELYVYDPAIPDRFWVYPPAVSGSVLTVAYNTLPTAHALTEEQLADSTTSETIRIADSYAPALLDYVLYRAYSKDADFSANAQRAVAHYQAMQSSLGVKTQSDQAVVPKG